MIKMRSGKGTERTITRRKGNKGRETTVQCRYCGRVVPRDKAIEKKRSSLFFDKPTFKILRKQGARIHSIKKTVYACIRCAKHRHMI